MKTRSASVPAATVCFKLEVQYAPYDTARHDLHYG